MVYSEMQGNVEMSPAIYAFAGVKGRLFSQISTCPRRVIVKGSDVMGLGCSLQLQIINNLRNL